MSVLAIIPARGGSKGIPEKNMVKLNGKPLIEYAIRSAKASTKIQKIVVSTDSTKIANFAKSLDVDVPFLRPKKLSHDSTSMLDVIKHTLDYFKKNEGYVPKIVCILQPTSPFRTKKIIDQSISKLEHTTATSIISVVKLKNHPYASFKINKIFLDPFTPKFKKYYQRQQYPELFYPTGSIYTFWYSTFKKYGNIYGPKIYPLILDPKQSIDIDDKFDLFVANMLLKYGKHTKFY